MFAVFVDFTIKTDQMGDFLPLMQHNAEVSVRDEPGCVQFDVVRSDSAPDTVMLYETYVDAEAFQAHLDTPHFRSFDAAVADMIAHKDVRTGQVV